MAAVETGSDTVEWLNDEDVRNWRQFIRSAVLLIDRLDDELKPAGLTLADYEILVHLSEAPEQKLRMAELADLALMSRSRLTYRVDRLVRSGLLEREPCRTDRRGAFAVLTETGFSALKEAAPTHVTGVRRYVIDHVETSEWGQIGEAMRRIEGALNESGSLDLNRMSPRIDLKGPSQASATGSLPRPG